MIYEVSLLEIEGVQSKHRVYNNYLLQYLNQSFKMLNPNQIFCPFSNARFGSTSVFAARLWIYSSFLHFCCVVFNFSSVVFSDSAAHFCMCYSFLYIHCIFCICSGFLYFHCRLSRTLTRVEKYKFLHVKILSLIQSFICCTVETASQQGNTMMLTGQQWRAHTTTSKVNLIACGLG